MFSDRSNDAFMMADGEKEVNSDRKCWELMLVS